MTILTAILLIACIAGICWLMRYIPAPWVYWVAGFLIVLLALAALNLAGLNIGLGTRIG